MENISKLIYRTAGNLKYIKINVKPIIYGRSAVIFFNHDKNAFHQIPNILWIP